MKLKTRHKGSTTEKSSMLENLAQNSEDLQD